MMKTKKKTKKLKDKKERKKKKTIEKILCKFGYRSIVTLPCVLLFPLLSLSLSLNVDKTKVCVTVQYFMTTILYCNEKKSNTNSKRKHEIKKKSVRMVEKISGNRRTKIINN